MAVEKENASFVFIECTEWNWNGKYSNGLCVSVFFEYTDWYLRVIGKLHNYECLVYIFTGEGLNVNPSIFNKSHSRCRYKELNEPFLPVIIDTTQ